MAYLDEKEDFRGYSEKSSMDTGTEGNSSAAISQFFRRQSTAVKKKYVETDFKGGAKNLGNSITSASKNAGAKISKGVKEINVKQKTEKVKTGFFRFATKVKGLFKSSTPDDEEEKDGSNFKVPGVNAEEVKEEEKADPKNESGDSDGSPIPDMMKLEANSDDE